MSAAFNGKFMIYSTVELAGSTAAVARVVDASLDRLEKISDIPLLDENGTERNPDNYNIEVKNISFSYDKKEVIKDVSFFVPQGTSLAIVGASGSGDNAIMMIVQ